MAKAVDNYDCTKCGACCISDWTPPTSYATVSQSDLRRLLTVIDSTVIDETVASRASTGQAMRTRVNEQGLHACVALGGTVGECVSCEVYEHRPDVCRTFQANSPQCEASRKLLGIDD